MKYSSHSCIVISSLTDSFFFLSRFMYFHTSLSVLISFISFSSLSPFCFFFSLHLSLYLLFASRNLLLSILRFCYTDFNRIFYSNSLGSLSFLLFFFHLHNRPLFFSLSPLTLDFLPARKGQNVGLIAERRITVFTQLNSIQESYFFFNVRVCQVILRLKAYLARNTMHYLFPEYFQSRRAKK
jgi:hypothetical protein